MEPVPLRKKIKTIIFDIDGVLVSTKELHEYAFLSALREFGHHVTHEQHRLDLDGLPTRTKLDKLGIPAEQHQALFARKQELTFQDAHLHIRPNPKIKDMGERLRDEGYNLAVASNAIQPFCELVVDILGLPVGLVVSNEGIRPKPAPDMYQKVMDYFGCKGSETLVCEDSRFGLQAAFTSGAYVLYVPDPSYLTYGYVKRFLGVLEI